ncbi:uncharacterized protein LOC143057102 [Mytilus galloprovincialis]|uniref:uncharacterized protein LOC143057102 n=1 Tax=Mytilus galloprovincialis TaxID=29158 RepID=UPI003F7BD9CF
MLDIGNAEKEIHIFAGKSVKEAIQRIEAKEEESYSPFTIIIHEEDDSEELVKRINSLKEDINRMNSENINFKGAEKGSIILLIDVKNRVVLDDGMFQSEVSTFIRKLFKLCDLTCYYRTLIFAVISSAKEEFEEQTHNLQEKATGTCLMGDKGNVVFNFEVNNKIFQSPDSLNRTSNGFF